MARNERRRSGFTLIEVSIVLTIIGLLIGGIIAGRAMIRASEVNSITRELTLYTQAVSAFRDKFRMFPGDLSNAEDIWGSDDSCPNTATTATPHAETCNGDGDNKVADDNGTRYESFRFWQHMANAGMIDGSFSGVKGPVGATDIVPGVNTPHSQLRNAAHGFSYMHLPSGDADHFPALGHAFNVAARDTATGAATQPLLTGGELLALDIKLDDGKPGRGRIITWKPAFMDCADDDDSDAAQYIADDEDIRCAFKYFPTF